MVMQHTKMTVFSPRTFDLNVSDAQHAPISHKVFPNDKNVVSKCHMSTFRPLPMVRGWSNMVMQYTKMTVIHRRTFFVIEANLQRALVSRSVAPNVPDIKLF